MLETRVQQDFTERQTVGAAQGEDSGLRESHVYCMNTRKEYVVLWKGGEIISIKTIRGDQR